MKTFIIKAKNVWLSADLLTRIFSIVIILAFLTMSVLVFILDPAFVLSLIGTFCVVLIGIRTVIGLLEAYDRSGVK